MKTATRLSFAACMLFVTAPSEALASPLTFDATHTGWWSPVFDNTSGNTNYTTSPATRGFFSFDLATLGPDIVTSAVLSVTRYGSGTGNEPIEPIGLFDVTTAPDVLHDTQFGFGHRSAVAEAVFADLGGGISYGVFNVPGNGASDDVLHFELNAAAVAAINASGGGVFSVGASWLEFDSGNEGIFLGSSLGGVQRLSVTAIPEPSSLTLAAAALVGLLVCRRPRTRRFAA